MDEKDRVVFERMAGAQERIAAIVEKQQPGIIAQIVTTGAAAVTVLGLVGVVDTIVKWIGG